MTKSKKIAIVCNYPLNPNRIGGMDRFYVAYDKRAKEFGYKVDWYFTAYQPFDFFSGLTIFSSNHQNVEQFFLEQVVKEKKEYDILITHFVALCLSFFKKAKESGIQYAIAVDHNPRPLGGVTWTKFLKNKIRGIVYSRYIDQFVGVSGYTQKYILKDHGSFLAKKTTVIYNGIDSSVFTKRTEENKNKFIVTSHLRYSKGIQDLLKAVSVLEENIKIQIHIDIYGDGLYEKELVEMTNEFNLNSIIHFKGSSSRLNKVYADYSYLIHPSYGETFCYSIIESLLCNVPAITTHEAGNVLSVIVENNNGFLFNAGNHKQLAKIINDIVLGKLKINNDVSAQITSNFNLEKMVNEHLKLLKV